MNLHADIDGGNSHVIVADIEVSDIEVTLLGSLSE